jgi:SAM-dependent methyltransferase
MTPDIDLPDEWLSIESCPACGKDERINRGALTSKQYHFGKADIPIPAGGISIAECSNCHLYYKTVLPKPAFLAEIFKNQAGEVWNDHHDFLYEIKQIKTLAKKNRFDLLDIGPSNGALLNAFRSTSGRQSGLDIVQHPGLESHLKGEFIHGLIDDEQLNWSQQPYDVITAFDVFEHLYNPAAAFRNLHALLNKGGIAAIETGDISSYWPSMHGANRWWYSNLFEHHVFWQPESLVFHARRHGFRVLSVAVVRHKNWRSRPVLQQLNTALSFGLWRLSATLYRKLNGYLGKPAEDVIPGSLLGKDHISIVLQKP